MLSDGMGLLALGKKETANNRAKKQAKFCTVDKMLRVLCYTQHDLGFFDFSHQENS